MPMPSVSIPSSADNDQDCSSSIHKSPKKPKSASVMEDSCSSRLEYKNITQLTNYTASSSFVPKIRKCFLTFCSRGKKQQNIQILKEIKVRLYKILYNDISTSGA